MKATLLASLLCVSAAILAAPKPKPEPTAAGFPVWTGVTDANRINGRELTPSDLRQRYTIVTVLEAAKFKEQLVAAYSLALYNKLTDQTGIEVAWEHAELARDTISVFSVVGGNAKKLAAEYAAMGAGKDLPLVQLPMDPIIYADVTFAGAPDPAGKYPYVYVLGPEGSTVICAGALAEVKPKIAPVIAQVSNASKLCNWRPYYGWVAEPKHCTQLKKCLAAGKPLDAALKQAQGGLKSKDAEIANECQIIYDAINQAKSDLLLRIGIEVEQAPHRAAYDVLELLKRFPKEKKRVSAAQARLKKNPDVAKLGKMFAQVMAWNDPDFTPKSEGEAKKIVAQLEGFKKQLGPMKESKSTKVQNGACVLETDIDDLIASIPTRVPSK